MTPVVACEHVGKAFPVYRFGLKRPGMRAVDDVSLTVEKSETLGIVGESGSGKSTLARLIVGLLPFDSGRIEVAGRSPGVRRRREMLAFRSQAQMVFQDPLSSLDPTKTIGYTLTEPLVVHRLGDHDWRQRRVTELLEQVGLDPRLAARYPRALSGGQRQRIAIARALAVNPAVLVCDEAVAALDLSTQAQVVNLLQDLQQALGLAIVFIGHDIAVVRHISHRIAVMHRGRIVETGAADDVVAHPQDSYTAALLRALPGQRRAGRESPSASDRLSTVTSQPEGDHHA
jgi:peptide/nickel transport system ATP-binding protein